MSTERLNSVRGSLLALVDQGLVSGSNFLLVLAIAHVVPVADFAIFAMAYSILIFLAGLHQAFLLSPLVVFHPELQPEQRGPYLAGLERTHVRFAAIAVLVALGAWWIPNHGHLIATAIVAGVLRLGLEFQRRVAYARHDSRGAMTIDLAGAVPLLVVAIWFITLHPNHLQGWHGMLVLIAGAGSGWLYGRFHNRCASDSNPESMRSVFRRHASFGSWLIAAIAVQWISDHLYPFIIAAQLGLEKTAMLMAARSIMNAGNVALNGLDAYGGPPLRTVWLEGNLQKFRATSLRVGMAIGLAVGVPCLLAMLFPQTLVRFLLPPQYASASWILVALAATFLLRGAARVLSMMLIAMKLPRAGLIAVSINALVTICMGPIIVQHYGLPGAVAALGMNALILLIVQIVCVVRGVRSGSLAQAGPEIPNPLL